MVPNLGPQYDLAARLAALEDTVRRMQSNPLAQAFSMTQSDGSVGMELGQDPGTGSGRWIVYQGTTTSRDPNTDQHPIFMYLGELVSNGKIVNTGAIFVRSGGQESMTIGDGGAGILDKTGWAVFTTDETAGEGIANPWIPLPALQPVDTSTWPATTATTWTTIAENEFRAQHSQIWWAADTYADTGTNGQVRVTVINIGDGSTVATGSTFSVTGGAFGSASDTFALPAGFWGQTYSLQLQAQVTSGTGNVRAGTFAAYGRSS